jgi:Zn finger protein HypA/HybF involved in hydrogenase expression
MNSRSFLLVAAMALTFSVQWAVAAGTEAPAVKAKAAISAKKSMAEKGSYHTLHVKGQKLDCEDCHEKEGLPDNTLKLRLHEDLAKDSPGAVSSESCHECHSKNTKMGKFGRNATWYTRK